MQGDIELLSYKGYYGKPVDVLPTGGILFIAPTEAGSSLFMYSLGETIRLSKSDLLVDGRWLEDSKFLVTEITPMAMNIELF